MSEDPTTITKYSSYTPAQKRASQLYRQKNKDKINEQRKKYYQMRKSKDPQFLEYKRMKAKEYYEKKKLDKVVIPEAKSDVEMKDIVKPCESVKILEDVHPIVTQTLPPYFPMPELVQSTKMDIDVPIDACVQLPKSCLKGKRTTTRKKVKTNLDKTD
jgi:hypothetical protein